MEVVKSYSLYLNTREANYGNSNNCTFVFTTPFVLTNLNNRFRVSTPMIELPYSFSQLNTNNNRLPYQWKSASFGNFDSSITFAEGNYNITQLIDAFVALLVIDINLNSPTAGITSSNILVSYNQTTSKTSFTYVNASYQATIVLKFDDVGFVVGTMFGFNVNTYVPFGTYAYSPIPTPPSPNTILTRANPQVSPNKVMVNPITSVYIRSESLKFESNYEAVVRNITGFGTNSNNNFSNFQNSDIVAKIPINTLPNSIIYFRSDSKAIITNQQLGEINLYVSDNLSPTYNLNLQGLNYGIFLLFEEITIPQLNQYKDKIPTKMVEMGTDLLEERKRLIEDLQKQKEELEKEIKQNNL
jgi:hypothetical protein